MKKVFALFIIMFVSCLFAGCGKSTSSSTSSPQLPASSTEVAASDISTAPVDPDSVHPMLFHVTGENGQEGYLFGTIHVGDERMNTALEKLLPFVDNCDALAVEFDIIAFENQPIAEPTRVLMPFLLTDGSTISDYMPAETYQKAYDLLREAKLPASLMKSYNLAMWYQLVEQAALIAKTNYKLDSGMDRSLIQHCYAQKIEVRDVESAELQYSILAGFSDELNLLMIDSTLNHLDEYRASIDALYNAWINGDPDEITAVVNEEDENEKDGFSEEEQALLADFSDKMLTQRNLGMRDRAVEWLKAGDKVFFAVGAAHLVNEDGLIALLRAAGYTVEQVSY
ncbi:MAG: TraB/GumN family protein [Oscillospiraceae bacterium]|nr:TraB/GumN family protein [Oscillospiraceae bacterium]